MLSTGVGWNQKKRSRVQNEEYNVKDILYNILPHLNAAKGLFESWFVKINFVWVNVRAYEHLLLLMVIFSWKVYNEQWGVGVTILDTTSLHDSMMT